MSDETIGEFRDYASFIRKLQDEVADLKGQLKEKQDELKKALEQYVSLGLQETGGDA